MTLPNQRQQGGNDVIHPYNIGFQKFAQVVPIRPSVSRESWVREVLGYGHVHDSVRSDVQDAGVVDEIVETLTIERLLHRLSSLLCTLLGCDLERDILHAAAGAFDQLLQLIRLLAGGCKHFGHL